MEDTDVNMDSYQYSAQYITSSKVYQVTHIKHNKIHNRTKNKRSQVVSSYVLTEDTNVKMGGDRCSAETLVHLKGF